MPAFARALQVVDHYIARGVAPCAVVEVGTAQGPTWHIARGRLSYGPDAPEARLDTVFDLASLTKVLATATVAMRLVEADRLDLGSRIADLVPAWRGENRLAATVTDLLAHSSGLPAHRPYYETCSGRAEFQEAICREPLESAPGTAAIYSDLGFILLGFILEDAGGAALDEQFDAALGSVGAASDLRFRPPAGWLTRTAPTTDDPRRPGIVDDRNAAALGGVAGHAGVFGTASSVGAFARVVLATRTGASSRRLGTRGLMVRFTSRLSPATSRALAWDTMLPTSSCGTRMSAQAFGHTGFTGTSLWIDPLAGVYVVLLTNRVYPEAATSEVIAAFRRALHDAVMGELRPSP